MEQSDVQVLEHYQSQRWVPHVTLAMKDLSSSNLQKAKKELVNYNPVFKQTLNTIHLVKLNKTTGRVEIINEY